MLDGFTQQTGGARGTFDKDSGHFFEGLFSDRSRGFARRRGRYLIIISISQAKESFSAFNFLLLLLALMV